MQGKRLASTRAAAFIYYAPCGAGTRGQGGGGGVTIIRIVWRHRGSLRARHQAN